MESIINKKAYWGEFTFEATQDVLEKDVIRIDVYRSFPFFAKKREASYFVENKRQLLKLFADESCSLRFYVGSYFDGKQYVDKKVMRKNKRGILKEEIIEEKIPAVDLFIKAFKYDIEPQENA